MTANQPIDFRGTGLDTDSDIRAMQPGDSDSRLNCYYDSSDESNWGNIINVKGNLRPTDNPVLPSGVNEVIGSCEDLANSGVIYFIWNSEQKHQIRRWFSKTNAVQIILESPVLNFKRDYPIYHSNVIGDILTWTDGYQNPSNETDYNGPRSISISKSLGYMATLPWPSGYTAITQQVLDAIRYPPVLQPGASLMDIPGVQSLFAGKYMQFCYQYVYFDNSKSVFSPLTELLVSQNEDGDGNFVYDIDNAVDINVKTGPEIVSKINICVKVNGKFHYIVETIEKYDESGALNPGIANNSNYNYIYLGDKIINEVDPAEVNKPYDFVPQTAACQEVVEGNTLVYANVREGYKTPTTDLAASCEIIKATNDAPIFDSLDFGKNINYRSLSFKRGGIYRLGIIFRDFGGRTSFVSSSDLSQVQIPSLYVTPATPGDEWEFSLNQKPKITWTLTDNTLIPEWAESYEIVCTKDIRDLERTFYFTQWGACLGDEDAIYQNDKTTLLIPSTVGYSYQSGDRLRLVSQYTRASEITSSDLGEIVAPTAPGAFGNGRYPQKNIDTYNVDGSNDIIYDFVIQSFNEQTGRISFSGEVTGILPTNAYVWEIYNPTRTTTESEIFYGVGQSYIIENARQPNRSYYLSQNTIDGIDIFHRWKKIVWKPQRVKFRVNQVCIPLNPGPGITWPRNTNVALNGIDLSTVLFLQFPKSVSTVAPPVLSNLADANTSAKIIGFKDEKYGTSLNGNWSSFNMYYEPGVYPLNPSTMINILSGNILNQNSWAVLSTIFNPHDIVPLDALGIIITAGQTHALMAASDDMTIEFDTNNNPAYVPLFTIGGGLPVDLELLQKETDPSFDIYLLCEDHSLSDFYESNMDSVGKPYVENINAERRHYIAKIRNGGRYFDNSFINQLFSFDSKAQESLQKRFNEITRIREVGFTLKVHQRNKMTAIYIGRTEIYDSQGASQLSLTDNILGSKNPADEYYGSYSPGADVKSIRNIYFADLTNGCIVRDAGNTPISISGNKETVADPYRMSRYFRNLFKFIRDNGDENFKIRAMWDEYSGCYYFTVKDNRKRVDGQEDISVTLAFHEASNRWKSFWSFVPEWYERSGTNMVSFKDGDIWVHYTNDVRNNFYGNQYTTKHNVICNLSYNTMKVFNNIDVDSNKAWEATNVSVAPNAIYPQGMRSRIKKGKFVNKEGKFHAAFMRDMLTPGINNQSLALVNGRALRGEAVTVTLENDDTSLVWTRQVIIYVTPSELTS